MGVTIKKSSRIRNRVGWFEIEWDLINEGHKVVRQIMAQCIVIRAEARYDRQTIQYTALSESFDEVPPGSVAPTYAVVVHDTDGETSIEFKRCS